MSKVCLFHGALLAQTEEEYLIVGDLKEPADYEKKGFKNPGELNPLINKFTKLELCGQPSIEAPYFESELEGEALGLKLYHRFIIHRNGSISHRLWNLIMDADKYEGNLQINARWLTEMPDEIWEIVRDQVLRC